MAACTTWRPAADPARALSERPAIPRARLVLRDSNRVTLDRPVVRSDSIVGEVWRGGATRVAVPLAEVVRVERAEYSAGRSLGLAAAVAAGVYLVYLAAFVLATPDLR